MYEGNVGAVARVAANFGVDELRIVAPQCDWRGADAFRFAKGAATQTLLDAVEDASLKAALRGCAAAVGFTRRTGAGRAPSVAIADVAALGRDGTLALVFGREDAGLTAEEVAACTHLCSLATSPLQPSLNLSHAVAVVAARVFESIGTAERTRGKDPVDASVEELHELVAHFESAMRDVGLSKGGNPERLLAKLRPVLGRARLSRDELAAFRTYLSKTQVALGSRVNRPKKT